MIPIKSQSPTPTHPHTHTPTPTHPYKHIRLLKNKANRLFKKKKLWLTYCFIFKHIFAQRIAPQIGQDDLNKSVTTNGSSSNQVQNNLMPIINSVSTILSKKIYQAKSITSVFPVDEPFSNQTNRYGNANNINKYINIYF
jgi:hypothetical protein